MALNTTKKRPATAGPAPKGKRQPYSRGRNNWEEVPGNALLRAIREEQLRRGENSDEPILEGLGLTRSAWNNIINGGRDIRTLAANPGRLHWIANYIGMPAIAVRVMAGEMPVADLKVGVSLDDRLRLTAEQLRLDPVWSVYAPHNVEQEWDTLPLKARMLIKALYDAERERIFQWTLENTGGLRHEQTRNPVARKKLPVVEDL